MAAGTNDQGGSGSKWYLDALEAAWQFFGSLTFMSERLPERLRISMFFALLRMTGRDFRFSFPSLPWYLRQEQGEIGGRRHFHFLLTGLPLDNNVAVSVKTCMTIKARWEQLAVEGFGFALSQHQPLTCSQQYIHLLVEVFLLDEAPRLDG